MTKFQKRFIEQFRIVLDGLQQYAEDPRFAGLTEVERDIMFRLEVVKSFSNANDKILVADAQKNGGES